MQLYVPLNTPGMSYDVTKTFAKGIAEVLERRHPELVISEMRRDLRAGKVFIDWSQNDEHKTTVSVYSLRIDTASLPAVLVPSAPPAPDQQYEHNQVRAHVRAALASLPSRERRIISLYYFKEATMKQIGKEIGVNESRVSQLHARAMARLRKTLTPGTISAQPQSRRAVA
jgi:RNA polymerase sigma factor (sigma-70 family)